MTERRLSARIVIVGAGIIGAASAYMLAREGISDIILIDRAKPGGGTTQQSAGLIGQVRRSVEYTQLTMQTLSVIRELADNGYETGWHNVGSLRISTCAARDEEFRDLLAVSRQAGLEATLEDPATIQRRYPLLDLQSATSVLWCSEDGYVDPVTLNLAYIAAAQERGVRLITDCRVERVITNDNRVAGVKTSAGQIDCEIVVLAVGAAVSQLFRSVSLRVPSIPIRHALLVYDNVPNLPPSLPVIRVPDHSVYVRQNGNGVFVGGFGASQTGASVELTTSSITASPVIKQLKRFTSRVEEFLPGLRQARLVGVQKGLPTCTPDGEFIIGEQRVQGAVVATGCNVHGVSGSIGFGQLVVDRVQGRQSTYGARVSPARFDDNWTTEWASQQALERYANYYSLEAKSC